MADNEKRFWVYGYLSYFKGFQKTSSVKGGDKLLYRTNLLIDPEDPKGKSSIKKIEAMIESIEAEVKMKPGKFYKLSSQRRCYWRPGEYLNAKDEVPEGYEDKAALRLNNKNRITFRDVDGKTPLTEEDGKFYSGTYVKVLISGYGISPGDTEKGGAGIFATVEAIQYLKKGVRFGGGGVSDSDFEDESENFDDDDEDEEAPKARKSRSSDDDEDDRPAKKSKKRPVDDDEDEDEAPKAKKKRPVEDDDEEEDERPAKKKKRPVDDDDDDVDY